MKSHWLTYTFRASDGQSFRLPPGCSVVVGRAPAPEFVDISFSHPALNRRNSRWVNSGDTCTVECFVNRWLVRVNGQAAPTSGISLQAGDLIELAPGLTLTVNVESTAGSGEAERGE